ncbi:hypothetical protein [Aureispira anguillae]|uniref:DUF4974 domain-containing protein n=1 Tax=Aureispira anguillae TaxID=2864201 RepID=A0A916DQ36_9BACT|nr:hypothetical protein [Aureispira anguillae]BDS09865.1 hypothetical protein AsAng_0005700 [Aureispira anguillae]
MISKKNIVTVFLLLSFLGLYAQEPSDAQRVNVHFSELALGDVLEQISATYNVRFSYGNDHLKLQKKISFHSEGKTLRATLEQLFDDNNIIYAKIGSQLVLKPGTLKDKKRKERQKRKREREEKREERDKETLERGTLFDFDIRSEIIGTTKDAPPIKTIERQLIPTTEIEPLVTKYIGDVDYENTLESKETNRVSAGKYKTIKTSVGQFSVLPFLASNTRYRNRYNVFSFNVLWGINAGVNGLEIGAIGNTIKRNVHGVQLAGFFNNIEGHVYGIQSSGVLNITKGDIVGWQLAGLWNLGNNIYGTQISILGNIARDLYGMQFGAVSNIATDVYGFQVSGLFNFANGKLFGSQIAGFGNVAWGGKSAVQFANIFNISAKAQFQIAGFLNAAQLVEGAQIGGLINIAKAVKGTQLGVINTTKDLEGAQIGIINNAQTANGLMLGLINIVDSIKGVPIGLINIVRKNGYNRIEVFGGDGTYVNFGAKFGYERYYHILQTGWKVSEDNIYTWTIGIGVGSKLRLNKVLHTNFELLTAHVNEYGYWTPELNMLNQFRVTLDLKIRDRVSLFCGPVFNALVSRLYNEDSQKYGSNIMPYTLFDQTNREGTNLKMWIGFAAGLRF